MHKKYLVLTLMCAFCFLGCNTREANHSHDHAHHSDHHTHSHETNSNDSYLGAYTLKDDTYGTQTVVTIKRNKRIMKTNALPNHDTGTFPNTGNPNRISAQNRTYEFPMNPVYTGQPKWVREPGVAINGVKFEPGTAEVVVCDTGENYRVEALQDVIDLGLDFNHAHVQPTGAYHYHGSPTSVIKDLDTGEDLIHIGFAHDGFPIYYSKSGKYKPSYKLLDGNRAGEDCTYSNPHNTVDISVGGHHDGTYGSDFEFVEGSGDLDECNGITIDDQYIYMVTEEFPYVSRCLMGEVEEQGPQRPQGQSGNRRDRRPSFDDLLSMMDTNGDKKISREEAKGPLSEQFDKIDANKDGFLSKAELEKAGRQGGPPPRRRG